MAKEEGASFWAHVCANLASRGVQDVFIVCCDGLKGLPQAVEATWPDSMVRNLCGAPDQGSEPVGSLRGSQGSVCAVEKIYTAPTEDTARAALEEFEASELGVKYPQSAKVWRDAWDRFVPFLQFPPMVRQGDLYDELD